MDIEDAILGKLTKDHLQTHDMVARQTAELEQIGDDLICWNQSEEAPGYSHRRSQDNSEERPARG